MRNRLVRALESHYQVLSVLTFIWGYKSDGCSLVASPASSTDPVDVILHMVRADVIHNKLDMTYVKASSANTGGHHYISYRVFEVLNEPFSIDLVLSSMEHDCLVSKLVEVLEEVIGLDLLVNEY